jgi:hypothetical protein
MTNGKNQDPEQSEEDAIQPIDRHTFFFETPLYDVIRLDAIADEYEDLDEFFSERVDAYSAKNHIDTTYSIDSWNVDDYNNRGFRAFRKIKLTCVRKPDDILYFFVGRNDECFFKVGQWPSLADLSLGEISKKYVKHMDRDDMKEFKKAIGLAAHGVGAGSFVYLRRIFEKLINEAYRINHSTLELTQDEFHKQRMDEKVESLKDYLPSQLVGMKRIYSILSDGVHNLSEDECLALFPALKLSIELILEQKIEADAKSQRDALALKQIQEIERSLKLKGKA